MANVYLERRADAEEGEDDNYYYDLIVEFDPDWQKFALSNRGNGCEFRVNIPLDSIENMNIPKKVPDGH